MRPVGWEALEQWGDDWRRVAVALRQLHRLTRGWPQRPGWQSSTDLLQAETGTRVNLGAMPPDGVARCRAAWARLTGRTTCVVHGDDAYDIAAQAQAAWAAAVCWDPSGADQFAVRRLAEVRAI